MKSSGGNDGLHGLGGNEKRLTLPSQPDDFSKNGGRKRIRTSDFHRVRMALSPLSYPPIQCGGFIQQKWNVRNRNLLRISSAHVAQQAIG